MLFRSEEKVEIIGELKKNSELVERENNKLFNQDELFKKQNDVEKENNQLVQHVDLKWYKKIWNKIKNIFK